LQLSSKDESYNVPDGYYYTKDHEWLQKKPDGKLIVGITDYAAKMLHDIVYVTLPSENQSFQMKDVFGQVESVKTVSDMYMPVSGTVLKSNARLTREPEIVSSSPYVDGWMMEIKAENFDNEIGQLLSAQDYRKYVEELKQAEQ
jgi:glycine cleavage system H protein